MVTKSSLIKQFKDSIPAWRSQSTLYRYPNLVSHFIEYIGAKDSYDRADAMKFLNRIANNGQSKNYVRWSAYVLSQFYKSLGITFPLTPGDLPPAPNPDELIAPTFSREYISNLIAAVKENGDARMKAYLALSTTFGLRRLELAKVSKGDISDGTIYIHTSKGGTPRTHLIPSEIKEYISGFDFQPVHPQSYIYLFSKMQKLAKLKHRNREGFHSIRRGLVTELLGAGIPIHIVYSFMRWKLSSRLGIVGTYARPKPEDVDRMVFEKHPFLSSWRQDSI